MRSILALTLLVSGLYSDPAAASCISVPKSAKDSPVKACESISQYRFDIVDNTFIYDKSNYRQALADLLRGWLKDRDVTWHEQPASVEFWLAVPEANPAATQARAMIYMGDKQFILFLSVHPMDWDDENIAVSVLGTGETYPQSYGYRAGTILVKKQAETSDENLHQVMSLYGAYAPDPVAPNWFDYEVGVFQENDITSAVMSSDEAQPYVARASLNHTMEWIALREKVFTFTLSAP